MAPPPGPAPEALPPPPAEAAVPAPPSPPPQALKPEDVVIAVQTELKRVGCDPGEIDGVSGGQSREALAAFGHFAKVDVGELAPTPEILEVIKSKADIPCAAPACGSITPPLESLSL
jgi:peptidoglycan hydrolase-like protein with peptidoglycan-binding domain